MTEFETLKRLVCPSRFIPFESGRYTVASVARQRINMVIRNLLDAKNSVILDVIPFCVCLSRKDIACSRNALSAMLKVSHAVILKIRRDCFPRDALTALRRSILTGQQIWLI